MSNRDLGRFSAKHDFPTWNGESIDYVLCSAPRCGSTLLGSLLIATGQLGLPLEYLNQFAFLPDIRKRLGLKPAEPGADIIPYLSALKRVRTSPNGVFGMKCHYFHVEPYFADRDFMAWLGNVKFIHVRRRDEILQGISMVIAEQTRQWGLDKRTTPRHDAEYRQADITRAIGRIRKANEGWDALLKRLSREPLTVYYEDLVQDVDGCCQSVCRFILGKNLGRRFTFEMTTLLRQTTAMNQEWRDRYLREIDGGR